MPIAAFLPHEKLFYLDKNPLGKPVVFLLHGLGADSHSWAAQIPDLVKAGFRVIAPDAPGFGQSSNPYIKTQARQIASVFADLADQLNIQSFIPVGISMGGTHALQLALDYPKKVTQLALVNTFSHLESSFPASLPYFALRFLLVHTLGLQTQARIVAKHIFPQPEQEFLRSGLIDQVVQSDPKTYRSAMRSLARFNVAHRLHEIQCPTLVISGEQDTTVSLVSQTRLANSISTAKHVIIPNAGHAVTVEQHQAFNQALLDFLHNSTPPDGDILAA
jgi:3-oxoadipate enol-lactonase